MNQLNDNASNALAQAARGFSVHPLNGKIPLVGGWPEQASTDPQKIAEWWGRWPSANVGIGCMKSGVFVVDVDTKGEKVGATSLAELEAEHGKLPQTYTVRTWSGGLHYYYLLPDGVEIGNSPLGKDIDIRGGRKGNAGGGQVVAAGSVIEGQIYSVLVDTPVAPAPQWLIEELSVKRWVPPKRTQRPTVDIATGEILDAPPAGVQDRLKQLLNELRDACEGSRNETLNRLAGMAYGYVAAGQLDEGLVTEEFRAAAEEIGLEGREIEGTLRSARSFGLRNPYEWKESRPFVDGPQTLGGPPLVHSLDDFGNADRLVERFGHQLRWISDTEQWAVYTAGRWTLRGAPSLVWARCIDTVRGMEAEISSCEEDQRKALMSFVSKSRSRSAVAAMRDVAQGDERIHVEMSAFDQQKLLLNLKNGVYDLESGELRAHDPGLYLMQQARVAYDPDASAAQWERFLGQVMPDQARRDYLARVVGYTLTAETSEQCIFVHVGTGANGKSVFLDVVMALMGEYAQSVPSSTLLAAKGEGIPNDVARMAGKRLLSTVETAAGKKLDEELVKQLTGGDTISARFMRAEFFDFKPVGKIHLATNHLPHVGSGYGTARRLQDIGWDVTIPEEQRDRNLADRIIDQELSGVLNWALRGYQDWRLQGLSVPDAVRERTADHIASSDVIGMWLEENTVSVAKEQETEAGELYRNYNAWAASMGMKPMTVMSFSNALKERGVPKGNSKINRRSVFFGLEVRKVVLPPTW